jgi:hypothetical protein
MARVKWDQIAEKFFEGGCSKGMCYSYNPDTKSYDYGEAWNGVSGFTDNPSGADEQASYADNIKYISMRGAENYGGTIKCFWYPENFKACLGKKTVSAGVTISQQARATFGFAVTTQVGNDTEGTEAGETIHLVWNATTSPSSKDYSSLNESPSPSELSFEFTANPIEVGTNYKPTCNMEISTVGMDATQLAKVEHLKRVLYGADYEDGADDTYFNTVPQTEDAPANWATDVTAGKYYTKSGSTYTVVASGATYSSSTQYYKLLEASLPSPADIITNIFGGSVSTVNPEG